MLSRTYWVGILVASAIGISFVFGLGILSAAILVSVFAFLIFVPLRSVFPETARLARATGTRRWVWLVGGALFAGGVGLMHILGDPVYHVECQTRAYRRCRTAHNWATVAYFAGVFGAVIAASIYPTYRLVKRGNETTAANVRSGYVAVSGEVVPFEETIQTPFTGQETVCYRYAVQERHNSRLFSDDGSWHTVAVGGRGVPFYVEDETGRVLVDPGNASLTLNEMTKFGLVGDATRNSAGDSDESSAANDSDESSAADDGKQTSKTDESDANRDGMDETVIEDVVASGRVYQVDAEIAVAPDETPPQRISDWEQEHGGVFPIVGHQKRYTEDQLRPGDDVTVAGKVEQFDYGYPESTVVGGDGAPAMIAAGKQRYVTRHLTGAVWVGGAIAVLLIPGGLVLMLLTL